MQKKTIFIAIGAVVLIMAAAYASTSTEFFATAFFYPDPAPQTFSVFNAQGFFMNPGANTVRFYGGDDSVNMGPGRDAWNMSDDVDVLGLGGPADAITFEAGDPYGSASGKEGYYNSRHYLKSYDMDTPNAMLELRSNTVLITTNGEGDGDVIIQLGF